MPSNENIDIELLAGLDVNSSEQEIRNAIKIIQSRIRSADAASIQIDAKLDDRLINSTLNKLQSILKTKEISIDTKNSIIQLQKEANAMMGVVTSANKAAKEKLEFTNANKKVEKSANDTADAIRRERDAMCSLDDIDEILERINMQGRRGGNVFQQFGTTLRNAFAVYSAANLLQDALYEIIDAGKESIETVKELNDAATSLRMATGGSFESVKQLVQDYNALGQELGAITAEVSDSADAWLRQGHNVANTNELIKDSMMLSKISSLNSADSTKYLTSAMQGYKVAVEDVVDVVSKLSSVDLESATDAAGLAEAMSRTAESARIAGVSMDRLLGMIATVGEVTQKSMSSIGESYKTIFSRMRDIKDGKLSVVGDDGEVENISNVEIILNQLGIKLRESNSEFRNFQEVLDDVADSWDSYSSVQQAAIAKAFSGIRQQENFMVLLSHYDKVKEYTDISANSEGVAEEKFGYYLESLEAKTNALKASLENLAAVTIDDELYGAVLDVTKSLVDATAASGLLKGALAGLATAGSVYAFQHLAGYVTDAIQSFSNLSEAMNMVNVGTAGTMNMHRLIDLTQGLSQSQTRLVLSTNNLNDAQKIAVLRAQGLSRAEALLQLQTWGVTSAQQGATAATITFGSAMRGLYMTLAANPLFVVATAVALGVTLWNKYKESVEDAAQTAEKAREHYQSLADELSTLNNELKTTKDRMAELEAVGTDSLSLVEQEEYDKLCKTNEELEREFRIKEALAKVAAKESAEASENALTDESYTSNTQTNRDGSSKKVDNIDYVEELVDRATHQKELLEEAKEELLSYENDWISRGGDTVDMVQSDEWQYLNDVVTNAEKAIGKTESAISEAYETLDEDASGLVDAFGNVVEGFEDTYNRVENVKGKVDNYFTEEPETTTKESLEQQFGKVRVSSLSDEDIDIAVNLKNIGDMTFDELKEEINNVKNEAKEPINIKVNTSDYLSNLESLSDGFEQISAIYKDVQDIGEFDFSALAKDSDFSKTFSTAGQAYQDFIDVVANSPSDINACQSAFDDLVSAWFYGKTPLKDITDETYDLTVAWLKQKGVANAVEVADNALAQSKARAWLATKDLTEMTSEEIAKFVEENATIGVTKEMLYQLQIQMIQVNEQGLNFSQQISALQNLAINAGIAADALDATNQGLGGRKAARAAERSGMSTVDYIASQLNQKIANATTKIDYTGSVGSGSGGGSSKKDPHTAEVDTYKNLTDAVDEYDRKLEKLERIYDHTDNIEERIALKNEEIKLYQQQKDAIDALNKARDAEITDKVNKLRGVGFNIDYDPSTEQLIIHNREHINDLSQNIIETYEDYIDIVDDLNDANKESADQWDELTYAIMDAADEIAELRFEQYEKYIEDQEHLIDLMANRKDAEGKDLYLYDNQMNATLKTWLDLVKDGYDKNKDKIQELEKAWMDYYDARIEREKELLENQLDDNDDALDAIIKVIDDEIKGLDDQIDALQKINDERRESLELQKAQAELDKARNQKTRMVLRKGVGWVYEADEDAIKKAEEELADKQYEAKVDALEDEKEKLEELKEKWEEIPEIKQNEWNEQLMIDKLGADAEEDILAGRTDVYEKFKDDYIDIQEQIQDKTDELEEHTSEAYLSIVQGFEAIAKLAGLDDAFGNQKVPTQSTQSSWYVNKDGSAPSQAKKGDIVYTRGGTFKITGKDENGKFTSQKIDNVSTDIKDGMWGKKISDQVIESVDDVSYVAKEIVDKSEDIVEQAKNTVLSESGLARIISDNTNLTDDEISAIFENVDITEMLSDETDDNTDATDENTRAILRFIEALQNLELEVPVEEMTLENFDDSIMAESDQAYIKELQRAWNLAMEQGNTELADMIHSMADEARLRYLDDDPNNDYNKIAEEFAKLADSKYEHTGSSKIGGSDGDSDATQKYLDNLHWLKDKISDENYHKRLDAVEDVIVNGSGLTSNTYTDQYGRTYTQVDVNSVDELNNKLKELGYVQPTNPSTSTNKTSSGSSGGKTSGQKTQDKYGMSDSDKAAIQDAQNRYNSATTQAEKDKAHADAEAIRNKYGYSGGTDGSKDIVNSNSKVANAVSDNSDAVSDNTDSNDRNADKNSDSADKIVASNDKVIESNEKTANAIEKSKASGGSSGSSGGSSGSKSGSSSGSSSSSSSSNRVTWSKTTNSDGSVTHTAKDSGGNVKASYTIPKKAVGGRNLVEDIYNVDEKGRELLIQPTQGRYVHLSAGSDVLPADITDVLWKFGQNPSGYIQGLNVDYGKAIKAAMVSSDVHNHYHIGNVEMHGVDDWIGFMNELQYLPSDATQHSYIR